MDRKALATLADLADRALKGDLARLTSLRAARRDLEAKIEGLVVKARGEAHEGVDAAALAAYAGWRDWAHRKRQKIEAEDRALGAKMEVVRRQAAARLGRCEAVSILGQRARHADLETERRQAERDGRPPDR